MLTLNYGVGAFSIALIVSVFMLGLGLGALGGGRLAERARDPYALYAFVEGALGIAGLASLPLIPALGRLTSGAAPVALFACVFLLLCVPTFLMGISLPLLTTIFARASGEFIQSVSHLCFINTLGAALGAAFTGYVLVPLIGLDGSIYLAAAIDIVLAVAVLAARGSGRQTLELAGPLCEEGPGLGRLAYLLVFVTGFLAIGYEIVWYRVIGVLVKDSPYAFSSILAIYLLGIAIGSRAIHSYLNGRPGVSRRELFFAIQFLVGLSVLTIFAGYYSLTRYTSFQWLTRLSFRTELHPSPALLAGHPGAFSPGNTFLLFDVFLWPLAFLFVPTLLMGASFPLISSLALSRRGSVGQAVGTTYFFGVVGNVLGGLVTGFVLLPAAGTETVVLTFGSLGLLFGLAADMRKLVSQRLSLRITGVAFLLLAALAVFPRRGELYAVMHESPWPDSSARFEEGSDAVVMTYRGGEQFRNFINGQGHGYRPGPLFYAEAIEGLAYGPAPGKILVIGFGTGSITEAALIPAEVREVTVVELCGSAIRNLRKFPLFIGILDNNKVRVVIDDGRRFLQQSAEKFDAILMDPLRTTSAYSNNLHSRQFFALAAEHLAPGGILMVGGLGESRVIPRTLLDVFPHVRTYPSFSVASGAPLQRNRARLQKMLDSFSVEMQAAIWDRTQDALKGQALWKAVAGCAVNTDLRPRSEYYLWVNR